MTPSKSLSVLGGLLAGLWVSTPQVGTRSGPSGGGDRLSGPLSPEQEALFAHLEVLEVPDGQGGTVTTLRVSGANLQVTNGLGATNGNPVSPGSTSTWTANGLGNVLIGYVEGQPGQLRTGSHNLVAGLNDEWQGVGGMLISGNSSIRSPFSTVTGGWRHQAVSSLAPLGSIAGGQDGELLRPWAVLAGGLDGLVAGDYGVVGGGHLNEVSGDAGVILGGYDGSAAGIHATIVGGQYGFTGGNEPTAIGGHAATVLVNNCTVAGGNTNQADGQNSLAMGGLRNFASGSNATVVGGQDNRATGSESTVHGGYNNRASGNNATVIGGNTNTASGTNSVAAGGRNNITSGTNSAISGGEGRNADQTYEWYGGAHRTIN